MRGEDVDTRFGQAALLPDTPVEVGARSTWQIVLTLADEPVLAGGSVRFEIPFGFSPPQTSYPTHVPGYVSARATRPDVRLELTLQPPFPAPDPRAILRPQYRVYVVVRAGTLETGDRLTLEFGHLSKWPEAGACAPSFSGLAEFTVAMDPDGSHRGRYTGYTLVGQPLALRVLGSTPQRAILVAHGESTGRPSATLTALDRYGNPAERGRIVVLPAGRDEPAPAAPLRWDLDRTGPVLALGPSTLASARDVDLPAERPRARIQFPDAEATTDARGGIAGQRWPEDLLPASPTGAVDLIGGAPPPDAATAPYHLYWGDLHTHSRLADGRGDPDELCRFARERAVLDFVGVHEHNEDLLDRDWDYLCAVAARHNTPGQFVTILGYEYSPGWPRSYDHGDKNVYFPGDWGPLFPTVRGPYMYQHEPPVLDEVAAALKEAGALMVAHSHARGVASFYDPGLLRLAEVYSDWGNSERFEAAAFARPLLPALHRDFSGHYVQDALAKGFRVGLIAGSDDHSGHPGLSTWQARTRWYPQGLVGVYARSLRREAVWEALWSRRCYATTGTRIVMSFSVNGAAMGSEISVADPGAPRQIRASVRGTGPVARVTVVRDNDDWHEQAYRQGDAPWDVELAVDDTDHLGAGDTRCYHLRVVQEDGNRAWSSPVWVSA